MPSKNFFRNFNFAAPSNKNFYAIIADFHARAKVILNFLVIDSRASKRLSNQKILDKLAKDFFYYEVHAIANFFNISAIA